MDLTSAIRRLHDLESHHEVDQTKEKKAIELAEERQVMRQSKRFDEADRLREEINRIGFQVLDKPDGFKIKPL